MANVWNSFALKCESVAFILYIIMHLLIPVKVVELSKEQTIS